jgi:hypothetical protein
MNLTNKRNKRRKDKKDIVCVLSRLGAFGTAAAVCSAKPAMTSTPVLRLSVPLPIQPSLRIEGEGPSHNPLDMFVRFSWVGSRMRLVGQFLRSFSIQLFTLTNGLIDEILTLISARPTTSAYFPYRITLSTPTMGSPRLSVRSQTSTANPSSRASLFLSSSFPPLTHCLP